LGVGRMVVTARVAVWVPAGLAVVVTAAMRVAVAAVTVGVLSAGC
jgi:hypothetical protein